MRLSTPSSLLTLSLLTLSLCAACDDGPALQDQPDEAVDRTGNMWNDPGAMPDPVMDAGASDGGGRDGGMDEAGVLDASMPDDSGLGDAGD